MAYNEEKKSSWFKEFMTDGSLEYLAQLAFTAVGVVSFLYFCSLFNR